MNINVNIEACEISFDLDQPIEIAREGNLVESKRITFKQPSFRAMPIYQNLLKLYNRAIMASMEQIETMVGKIELEKVREKALEEQKKGKTISAKESLEKITNKSVTEEVEGTLEIMASIDLDWEKVTEFFKRMLFPNSGISEICSIGGIPFKLVHLEKVFYQDFIKLVVVYLVFFAKPVKTGTQKESELPSEYAGQAKEV